MGREDELLDRTIRTLILIHDADDYFENRDRSRPPGTDDIDGRWDSQFVEPAFGSKPIQDSLCVGSESTSRMQAVLDVLYKIIAPEVAIC